ncbi:MAG: glutamine synthetase [Candidatus Eremiobacteraeota bacterium]|nr:glutamine synthetase [Candidatus Eremiobacteraeota bacterium]
MLTADEMMGKGIRFLRVLWCDNANVMRAKAVHVGSLRDDLAHGVGISAAQQAVPVTVDAFEASSGLGPVGEIRLVPVWDTYRTLPFAPGHACVLGRMMLDAKPWPHCPRHFLERMLARAEAAGLSFQVAFENEFYLLKPSEQGFDPADQTLFCAVSSMNQNYEFIEALCEALLAQKIPIEQYYPESGFGQQEVSVGHTDPLTAVYRQLAFRETVHAIAHQQGYRASFVPKLYPNQAGSGCHLHLSLWSGDQNLGIEGAAASFMAGLLEHLPALMAITTPIPNSYRRLGPHLWSGAFACWGMDNREAALRVPSNPGGLPEQFELKTLDGAANPYLALGAVLAAGLDGITRGLERPAPVDIDPGLYSDEERQSRGIARLPDSLARSLEAFEQDSVLAQAMGAELARSFVSVRRKELADLGGLELEEEVRILLDRY